eukprot:1886495-Pyramimonas_sp.AAC.1
MLHKLEACVRQAQDSGLGWASALRPRLLGLTYPARLSVDSGQHLRLEQPVSHSSGSCLDDLHRVHHER